jgi:hypothetical protein
MRSPLYIAKISLSAAFFSLVLWPTNSSCISFPGLWAAFDLPQGPLAFVSISLPYTRSGKTSLDSVEVVIVIEFTLFVSHPFTDCCPVSILKFILSVFCFVVCLRWEHKSFSCYSILTGSGFSKWTFLNINFLIRKMETIVILPYLVFVKIKQGNACGTFFIVTA